MGMLVDGQWTQTPLVTSDAKGRFNRVASAFRQWINREAENVFQPAAGRYHLYVSYACPWASRTLVMRALKGLQEVISVSAVEPLLAEMGWEFGQAGGATEDRLNHKRYLHEIYQAANPHYTGKVTVPVLWDKQQKTIVNNESADVMRMLNSEFNAWAKNTNDFYPEALRAEIDAINDFVYRHINNGVYKCGFAVSQEAYDEAFTELFNALDEIEQRLGRQRYLVGQQMTEADWRLFTTLIRFDVVYFGHFKCNLKPIEHYPHLSNYLRELYQVQGIRETVNFKEIKEHYYRSHKMINPSGIVPKGPAIDFDRSYQR